MSLSDKNNEIFSGLEDLGFDDTSNMKLFKSPESCSEVVKETAEQNELVKQKSLLYDREIHCPVCGSTFTARAVKASAARIVKKDSDFFIRHSGIDPYFYDVFLCNTCGYAAMKSDFERLRGHQIEKIQKNISLKWRGRQYPEIYDLDIAIERYKLSLLNYCAAEAKSSSKAMNCLKLAWMFRLKEDAQGELTFLVQALEGFNDAYYTEDFPIYGMDRYTTMYLLGELNRRLQNYDEALKWFSKIVTTPSVPQKLKDLARDSRDLIKHEETRQIDSENISESSAAPKKGLLSRIFK